MINTLDRYLIRSFLINYVLSLGVLISLYIVLDLFVNFDEFTEGGKRATEVIANIFDYYAYNMPLYFSQLSGVITLFAACSTLARLQKQNEITAVLASGTSMYRLVTPIILAGLVMNGLLIFDYEVLLPRVAAKLARQRDDVEGARVYDLWCIKDGDSRLLSALQFSPQKQQIRNLIIMELSTEPESRGRMGDVITAYKAQWNPDKKGWDLLAEGKRISPSSGPGGGLSGEHSLVITPLRFYPCELDPDELMLRKQVQWIRFLSIAQLNKLEQRGDVNPTRIAQVKHIRFTGPIHNMIMLLLGLTFFMNRLPEGILTQAAKSLGTCTLAFVVAFIGQQLVGTADVSPALPAWLPIFLFGPLAVVLLDNVKT